MRQERILILDDEPAIRELCADILRGQEYLVTIARTGPEALECLQREAFDLLLTDISMPGMTGLEVAQAAKAISPDLVCVTMTGYSTMEMAIQALNLGVDEFLLKPYRPEDLHGAITRALEKSRLRRENARLEALVPLFELNRTLLSTVDAAELLEKLRHIARSETKASNAWIVNHSADMVAASPTGVATEEAQTPEEQGLREAAARAIKADRQLHLTGTTTDPWERAVLESFEVKSVLLTPLVVRGSAVAILIVARAESEFESADADFLSVLAGQAGIALENARLFAQLQQAYEEIKKLDHLKGEFISVAAHELRTPVAVVTSYTEALEEEMNGAHNDYFAPIRRNCDRLRHLINSMMNLHVLEERGMILTQDRFELRQAVQEAINDVVLWAEGKELDFIIEIMAGIPTLVADRPKVGLMLNNLLTNAVKFTPRGGQITLRARPDDACVVISLTNTGISIPAGDLEKVFERFYQVEPSLTREHQGLGLGLAIVRGMAELCGGRIHAESEEGQSTTFVLRLPIVNTASTPRTTAAVNR